MAEGGAAKAAKKEESSDEVVRKNCDCCSYGGTVSEAVAFCVFCTDFLCHSCLRVHKNQRLSRNHDILDGSDISKAKGHGTANLAVEMCDCHRQKITLYCKGDDTIFCDICKAIDHRTCYRVLKIDEIDTWEGVKMKEPKDVLQETRSLIDEFKLLETQRREALTRLPQEKATCLQELEKQRNDINKSLDQMEQQIRDSINTLTEKETKTITEHLFSLEIAIKTLEAQASDLDLAMNCGEDKAFIAMRRVQLSKLKRCHSQIQYEKYQEDMGSEIEEKVFALQEMIYQLSQLRIHSTEFQIKDAKVISGYLADGRVKIPIYKLSLENERDCDITGSQVLPSGEFLLCDYRNKNLKILSLSKGLMSHVELKGEPYDVCLISQKEAVVTVPELKQLQFVSFTPELKLGKTIELDKPCWGIVYDDNTLYVASYDGSMAQVLLLNMQGNVQRTVCSFSTSVKSGSTGGFNLARDTSSKGLIYIIDKANKAVICFSSDGKQVYKKTPDRDYKCPCPSYLLANEYNAFVCCDNNTIQSVDGGGYRHFHPRLTGLKSKPLSMAYRSKDNTLLVGFERSCEVAAYRFV